MTNRNGGKKVFIFESLSWWITFREFCQRIASTAESKALIHVKKCLDIDVTEE